MAGVAEQVHTRAIDLGLGRVGAVARTLGVDRPAYRSSPWGHHGKGSTVATLEALLLALGLRVGSLTSPHLLRYNERIHLEAAKLPMRSWLRRSSASRRRVVAPR